jgi:transposase
MASERGASRRRHSEQLKARVLAECAAPGASVAKVAMSHELNANVVHRWRRLAGQSVSPVALNVREFVPVSLRSAAADAGADIRIELRRGATAMTITWPTSASADCAAWMRELLR